MTPAELLVTTLESRGFNPRRSGAGWAARCPGHEDARASLSISIGRDGRVLLKCHAGCEAQAIVSAIGLELKDLFQPSVNGGPKTETRYVIRDASGRPAAIHVRYQNHDGTKAFSWEREGAPSLKGLPVTSLPLYGVHLMAQWVGDRPVIVCEGEKAADALTSRGFWALGTVCGASCCPSDAVLEALRGRSVILWPDHDAPGTSHMARVARRLGAIAASVHVFVWAHAVEHDDAHDYFDQGGTTESLALEIGTVQPAGEWVSSLSQPKPTDDTLLLPTIHPVSASELLSKKLPPIESFLDEAALPRGHVAMLHGKGGLGKSYIVIGLGICLATQTPWLSLPVKRARTLMVTYEVPARVAQEQISEWCTALEVDPPDDFLIVTMEGLVTALLEPGDGEPNTGPRDRLLQLSRLHRADVLILDPWRSCHHAEEQDSRAMSQLMEALRIVAAEAGVALLMLHHDRKTSAGGKETEDSADASRGSSAMRDSARSVARLYGSKGSLCLEFHKVNLGSKPRPIWLAHQDHAPPRVVEPPEVESARGRKNRIAKLKELMQNNPEGVTLQAIAERLEVAQSTARRYLFGLPVKNLRPLGDEGLYILGGGRSNAH